MTNQITTRQPFSSFLNFLDFLPVSDSVGRVFELIVVRVHQDVGVLRVLQIPVPQALVGAPGHEEAGPFAAAVVRCAYVVRSLGKITSLLEVHFHNVRWIYCAMNVAKS